MEDERLTNIADALRVEGRKTKGRPRRSWEEYVKRGVREVGGEWRTRARYMGEGRVKEEENQKSTTSIDACFSPDKEESNK